MVNKFITNSPWTPERVETLERMVADGWTSQKISDAIKLTRSAVMGKIKRSKLTLKTRHGDRGNAAEAPADPKPKMARKRPERHRPFVFPSGATQPAPGDENAPAKLENPAKGHPTDDPLVRDVRVDPFAAPSRRLVSILNLKSHHCRWPLHKISNGPTFYCGHNRSEPHPYCAGHARIAYRPQPQRKT